MRGEIANLDLSQGHVDEALAEAATIEAQAKSPRPRHGLIRASVQSIVHTLELAAGSVAGHALITELAKSLA